MALYKVDFSGNYRVSIASNGEGPVDAQDRAARLALAVVREALIGAGFTFKGGGLVSHHATPRPGAKLVKSRMVNDSEWPTKSTAIIRIGQIDITVSE